MDETIAVARQAIANGQRQVARTLLMQLARDPVTARNGEVWHLLGHVLDDPAQQADCAQRAAKLGYVAPVPAAAPRPTAPVPVATPVATPVAQPVAPVPQPAPAAPVSRLGPPVQAASLTQPSAPAAAPSTPQPAPQPIRPVQKRRSRVGAIVPLIVLLVLLVGSIGGYAWLVGSGRVKGSTAYWFKRQAPALFGPLPCGVAAAGYIKDTQALFDEWDDANSLAGKTSRMSLAPQIATLQELRRRVTRIDAPPCAADSKTKMIEYMDASIEGYEAFLTQEGDTVVNAKFATAKTRLDVFFKEFIRIKFDL